MCVCVCVQIDEAEVLVADTSGESVDNKTRLDLVRQQEELIKEEALEKEMEKEVRVTIARLKICRPPFTMCVCVCVHV